ncbi:MAG: acyl carrier protein [Jatrophihabitantaceae bacterium]
MAQQRRDVERTITGFLSRAKKRNRSVELDTPLYAEGIGLDSLETAELAAMLEDELGSDPFSEGLSPRTVGDIVEYYEAPAVES